MVLKYAQYFLRVLFLSGTNKCLFRSSELMTITVWWLIVVANLTYLERGNINWGTVSIRLACRQVYGGIFLMNDWCRKAQPTVGSATPGKVVLGSIRKHAGKQWFPHGLCFISYLQVLPWVPALSSLHERIQPQAGISLYVLKLLLAMVFMAARERKLGHTISSPEY